MMLFVWLLDMSFAALTVGLVFTTDPTVAGQAAVRPTASSGQRAMTRTVPLRVQRLLKKRVPAAAYVPTRLPVGYRYVKYENLNRTGFDLYFGCCRKYLPSLGFDALLLAGSEPCNQGQPAKVFWIEGTVVYWNANGADQSAWRCIRHGRTRLMLTVSGGQLWIPRKFAWIAAWARPIK
jgi:hypothetical protein